MCNGSAIREIRDRTHNENRADDQAHDQQTERGPAAGERGI
jgi:hypothetical protein